MQYLLPVFLLATVIFTSSPSFVVAGPVNNPSSFPAAYANDLGSFVAIGDLKVFVRWVPPASNSNDASAEATEPRDSATFLKARASKLQVTEDIYTGGIASSSAASSSPSSFTAVACSDVETQVFVPIRTLAKPAGSWSVLPSTSPAALRRCAMTNDGTVAEYFPTLGTIVLSSNHAGTLAQRVFNLGAKFTFPPSSASSSTTFHLLPSGSSLLLLTSKTTEAALIQNISASQLSSAGLASTTLKSPFTNLQYTTRFASNAQSILRADSLKVEIATLSLSPTSIVSQPPTPLRISPCADSEACGVSLSAVDASYAVVGYWGSFLGLAGPNPVPPKRFVLPLGIETRYGTAFAHQRLGGRFVYMGVDDGDLGVLPSTVGGSLRQEEVVDGVWTVWKRQGGGPEGGARETGDAHGKFAVNFVSSSAASSMRRMEADYEFTIPLTSGLETAELKPLAAPSSGLTSRSHLRGRQQERQTPINRSLLMTTHRGPLPDPIPDTWIHWEPSTALSAPTFEFTSTNSISASTLTEVPWWSTKIGIRKAWDLVAQSGLSPEPIHIAIIDSGVIPTHPFFNTDRPSAPLSFYTNPTELPQNALDDDRNGFVDDVYGYDFVQETGNLTDPYGHGTLCSGFISSRHPTDPNFPLAPARNARLTMARGLDAAGKSNSVDLSRGIGYVVKKGVEVVSCSWGGGSDTQALRDAFALLKSFEITTFSSAGNDGSNTDTGSGPQVPKRYPGVISVGASTSSDGKASFSNFGSRTVQFFAPGDNVLSTNKNSLLTEASGTSFASPLLASSYTYILGLLKARSIKEKNGVVDSVKLRKVALDVLCRGSVKVGGLASVCGRVDLEAAVRIALTVEI
ncbi:hypothetical protein HDV05_005172 [Chytridiales sp. JEL 0842]|nr:hypothetical protein HDV05_005172 [Chytridiales sp. JEL 0842]